ncbi:hypothetical protein [Halioxenophilus aromaticivorans]|uniref:Uncharacterized protein n=1 Tax=Halioxenophilus aromaticivorans TaxID=1306992 RepID=A0AAV3U3J8_9ALTE
MALYTTIHLYNVPADRQQEYSQWFEIHHQQQLSSLRGFCNAERYEIADIQIMPDILQPWQFMTVYEFDTKTPEIDLPALGPLLANARDASLISTDTAERIYSYEMFGDWKVSPNWQQDKPLSGVSIILGNYVAGHYEAYQKWYEEIHSVEVINVPGHVGMKRGELSTTQVEPKHYCPGDQLVLCAQQTDDLLFTVKDFSARARGVSPSGIVMEPRSNTGSFARTVHYFNKISGEEFWPGGIAYAGDLSVYEQEQ